MVTSTPASAPRRACTPLHPPPNIASLRATPNTRPLSTLWVSRLCLAAAQGGTCLCACTAHPQPRHSLPEIRPGSWFGSAVHVVLPGGRASIAQC
eukprot:365437-Chlamydomonas_euryale.AAC.1